MKNVEYENFSTNIKNAIFILIIKFQHFFCCYVHSDFQALVFDKII